jgi:hypothetical protein
MGVSFEGQPQTPEVPLRGRIGEKGASAKQNNAFCFFFWKKKNIARLIVAFSLSEYATFVEPHRMFEISASPAVMHPTFGPRARTNAMPRGEGYINAVERTLYTGTVSCI